MRKRWLFKLIFIGAGALLGFLYYSFIGYVSGTCPITSSPVIATLYGALSGFVISMIFEKPKEKKE